MKLFHAPASPFVRKVVVMLHEMGIQDQVTLVPVSGNPLDPGSLPVDLNPLGKIPALLTDGGQTLYDSRVICRYLDSQFNAGLYPPGDRLWDCLTLEATGDGICDAAVLMRYETVVRPEPVRSPEWLEAQWAKIARALDALETRWIDHLDGPLDMGQVAVACALGYLDFRLASRPWRADHPDLAAWEARISARPSLLATVPVG